MQLCIYNRKQIICCLGTIVIIYFILGKSIDQLIIVSCVGWLNQIIQRYRW